MQGRQTGPARGQGGQRCLVPFRDGHQVQRCPAVRVQFPHAGHGTGEHPPPPVGGHHAQVAEVTDRPGEAVDVGVPDGSRDATDNGVGEALAYHDVVKPSGSQFVNHDVPSESTTTLMRMPIRKMKNAAVPAHTNQVDGAAASERSPGTRVAAALEVRGAGSGASARGGAA